MPRAQHKLAGGGVVGYVFQAAASAADGDGAGEGALHVVQAVANACFQVGADRDGHGGDNAGDGGKHGVHRLARVGITIASGKGDAGAGGAPRSKTSGSQVFGAAGTPGVGHQKGSGLVPGGKVVGFIWAGGGNGGLLAGAGERIVPAASAVGNGRCGGCAVSVTEASNYACLPLLGCR